MASWLEDMRAAWDRNAMLTIINLRGRPQRVDAAAVDRALEWKAQAQGQGWGPELSAEVFANVLRLLAGFRRRSSGQPRGTGSRPRRRGQEGAR